jgi:hypothetical protein
MERIMLTFIACLGAGLILAGVWAFVSYGTAFEAIEDRVTAWLQHVIWGWARGPKVYSSLHAALWRIGCEKSKTSSRLPLGIAGSVLVDAAVLSNLKRYIPLAPLHQSNNLALLFTKDKG